MWSSKKAFQRCRLAYQLTKQEPIVFSKVSDEVKHKNTDLLTSLQQREDIEEIINELLHESSLLDLSWMSESEQTTFYENSKQFVADAKAFDVNLKEEEIFQALRNIWIVWMLELLFDRPLQYHRAMFAYSMLYPYSDNYLDDHTITNHEKAVFNDWFTKRLHGEKGSITNDLKQSIHRLLCEIESYFPRADYPDVYESLYLIQQAQIASIDQQMAPLETMLELSIEKGGASVIADGYLIDGRLCEEEFQFCVDFGFGLQLCDDLQDEEEDYSNRHHTLMTMCNNEEERWQLFTKCSTFLRQVIEKSPSSKKEAKRFVSNSCLGLLSECVLRNEQRYPKACVSHIKDALPMEEEKLPVILKQIKKKMESASLENKG